MKINKFLEQVVTVDHVANVLTTEEIEEAIEQTEMELEDVVEDIEKQQTYKEYIESVLETLKQAREMKLVGNSTVESIGDEAREFWQEIVRSYNDEASYAKLIVNKKKKTIVALNIGGITGNVYDRSVAKCHPDDEWDEDIGKAIAVGRLFGRDISRFTDIPPKESLTVRKESLPDNSFVHTTPDGKTFRVVERRAKVGERVVIVNDKVLTNLKVGEVAQILEQSKVNNLVYARNGRGKLNIIDTFEYYVIIEELPF